MRDGEVPGLSIVVIHDRRIAWHQAYGVANAELRVPLTENAMFESASLTKPVFAPSRASHRREAFASTAPTILTPFDVYVIVGKRPCDFDLGVTPRPFLPRDSRESRSVGPRTRHRTRRDSRATLADPECVAVGARRVRGR
jgi:hypothetical protein